MLAFADRMQPVEINKASCFSSRLDSEVNINTGLRSVAGGLQLCMRCDLKYADVGKVHR